MKVAVLKGGRSLERQVSLRSGARVEDALASLGHEVDSLDVGGDLVRRLRESRPDVAFIALHGPDGEDGTAQELLEICVEIRSHHDLGKVGALAVIANPEQTEPFARVLGALALADRPMRLFDNPTRARNWLDAQPRASESGSSPSPGEEVG